ncbi:AtpZ/AtpI family protein [Persicimonas caeni]|uniref:AtpZ/AtpI family protein n=1 Tax=Persicimonas caeni TaxID=2292766 RepID=A0A4Y6PS39_PERCE|nr:AtpZ/AtpI family protein [Persicimonas caeni]QDG50827.1 AtpZ/AtpI family protein [Persicimonas caeni]QED32048.1 AtpZ/AtpI family protein [Persicimonas caeni]
MTDSKSKVPKRPASSDADEQPTEERSPWLVAGVFGALGFEFVGFIIGGYIVGALIDGQFGTHPWGVIVMVLLGLVGVLWHIYRVAKRFLE